MSISNRKDIPIYFALFIIGLVFPPLLFIILMWFLQKYFPKMRTLFICSIPSTVIVTFGILAGSRLSSSFENELIAKVFSILFYPGSFLARLFCMPDSLLFMILGYLFSIIFYMIIIYGIVVIISYIKRLYYKTGRL